MPLQNPGVNRANAGGNVISWLEEALHQERQSISNSLELKHKALLADLKSRIDGHSNFGRQINNNSSQGQIPENDTALAIDEPRPLQQDNSTVDGVPPIPSPGKADKGASSTNTSGAKQSLSRNKSGTVKKPVFASNAVLHDEMTWYNRVCMFINGTHFELFFGFVIVVSAVTMALEMQYRGIQTGKMVEYRNYEKDSHVLWPWAGDFFDMAEWILGILFTLELLLKLFAQGRSFPLDYWNWIDVVIVTSWLVTVVGTLDVGFNPSLLRTFRLMRLLRLLKLLGMISIFDSLYLMTTAIKGSLSVLLWAVLVLTVVEMLLACILQAMLEDYIRDPVNQGTAAGMDVYRFFGSFARSMLTMFEMTLGNWIVPCRALVENVSEWYMIFFLFHKFIIGFSVVSVITGVFIQETFKVATSDDQIMLNNKARAMRQHEKKMSELFRHADTDGSGNLDRDEFVQAMNDPSVKKWLSSMGLDVEDTSTLFDMIHGGDHHVNAHELVCGAGRLKGAARSIDLNVFMSEFRQSHKLLQDMNERLQFVKVGQEPPSPTLGAGRSWWCTALAP